MLVWVKATEWPPEELHRIFHRTRSKRRISPGGDARFRRRAIDGERGVARQRAEVWLSPGRLTVEFADEPQAQHARTYEPDRAHLKTVAEPHPMDSRCRSPQPVLWDPPDGEWRLAFRRPPVARRHHHPLPRIEQTGLVPDIAG